MYGAKNIKYKNLDMTCFGRNRPSSGNAEFPEILRRVKTTSSVLNLNEI